MAGEIITATTLPEAKDQLRSIYVGKSSKFKEITKEKYEKFEPEEREDSDNHINEERLGKESDVIDLAFYKYLKDREVAYRIVLKHKDGEEMEDYFVITPNLA